MEAQQGKWTLYERATGQRIERWPVDAREILAAGPDIYTLDPLDCEVPVVEEIAPPPMVDPVPHVTQAHAELLSPTGAPLIVGQIGTAGPAKPVQLPTARLPKGAR